MLRTNIKPSKPPKPPNQKTAQPHILLSPDAVVLNTGGANRKNNSKLGLGTIKNGSAASDLPPEGPPKER